MPPTAITTTNHQWPNIKPVAHRLYLAKNTTTYQFPTPAYKPRPLSANLRATTTSSLRTQRRANYPNSIQSAPSHTKKFETIYPIKSTKIFWDLRIQTQICPHPWWFSTIITRCLTSQIPGNLDLIVEPSGFLLPSPPNSSQWPRFRIDTIMGSYRKSSLLWGHRSKPAIADQFEVREGQTKPSTTDNRRQHPWIAARVKQRS